MTPPAQIIIVSSVDELPRPRMELMGFDDPGALKRAAVIMGEPVDVYRLGSESDLGTHYIATLTWEDGTEGDEPEDAEYLDTDGYPTDDALDKIANWPSDDFAGLMDFVEELWAFDGWGWSREGNEYHISTGGWSGNEELIGAMKSNHIFWIFCWVSSRRGGHFVFELPGEDAE